MALTPAGRRTTNVSQAVGDETVDVTDDTFAVTGPLTDTQMRASAVPMSAAALPLPTGAATGAKQDTAQASLSSIDTKLSNLAGASGVAAIAAGAAGPTVIKAGAGRLVSVIVTTIGAGVMIFYDNASAASGTIIGVIAASAPVGLPVVFNFPFASGCTASGGATMPGVTVLFS